MISKLVSFSLLAFLFVSCQQKKLNDSCALAAADKFLSFRLDEETKMPYSFITSFADAAGSDFMCIQNGTKPELLIYAIETGKLEKKIKLSKEGDQAIVGGFGGCYIQDFNHIYVVSFYTNTIHVVDSNGVMKRKIDFSQTDSGQQLIPFINSCQRRMYIIDSKIYIPQTLSRLYGERIIEDSPIGAVIDTVNHHIAALPMKHPRLITKDDIGTAGASGAEYSFCFNGKTFVYAFAFEEIVRQTTLEHKEVKTSVAKSRYIDKIEVIKFKNQEFDYILRNSCEHPSYGNIVYDKYRNVYYRFVFPGTQMESNENYLEIHRFGRKRFSIMVLDEDLQPIGETLFPEYTYNPNLYLLLPDGLYLSTSHIKNPKYSDDELCFQRIDLIKNE